MLFMVSFEWCAEDIAKVTEKFKQLAAEREKWVKEGKIPKLVHGSYNFIGETKSFAIYETDDPDKLMSFAVFWGPEVTVKYAPIIESSKIEEISELWGK